MARKSEKGVALILTMILILVLSVMAVSMLFISQSETWSGMNYRMMTQSRYAAEAGVHKAANFLQSANYTAPTAAQIAANFTTTSSPIVYSNAPAALSANSSMGSNNYPIASDATAFGALSGTLTAGNTTVSYTPYAKLLAIQSFTGYPAATSAVVEKWEITSDGTINGVRNAQVRVSAIMERQKMPTFAYAAFATAATCGALSFGGGGTTDSYDSALLTTVAGVATPPSSFSAYGGNVGTNGNLDESGNKTDIGGTLSTPRSGTGTCTSGNITALSQNGNTDALSITELPQAVTYVTPPAPTPAPPTTAMSIGNKPDCTGIPSCTTTGSSNSDSTVITAGALPTSATSLGSLTVQGNLHFAPPAGTSANSPVYINVNSITTNGNPTITIDPIPSGPDAGKYAQIVLNVAPGGSIDLTGSTLSNPTLVPADFQVLYGGTNLVKINGGTQTAMLLYAPNASFKLNGGGNLYGSVIAGQVTDLGGGAIHYDRELQAEFYQLGSYMLSSFNWQKN